MFFIEPETPESLVEALFTLGAYNVTMRVYSDQKSSILIEVSGEGQEGHLCECETVFRMAFLEKETKRNGHRVFTNSVLYS